MDYSSCIIIELLSMFHWKDTGWKVPVDLIEPDLTIRLSAHESMTNGNWNVNISVAEVTENNEWADESFKEKVINAVVSRCNRDLKAIQIINKLGGNVAAVGALKSNMFYPTDCKVNFSYKYRFIVAMDGESLENISGVYLVPSYYPSPKDGFDVDPIYGDLYKRSCYVGF